MIDITSETEFENKIRQLIQTQILPEIDNLILLQSKKAVDIILCKNGESPKLFFIEVKYHKKIHGRLGFGSMSGIGFQPEILTLMPSYFSKNMLWILGEESSESYWLLNNEEIRNYVSGGVISKKYNNIQNKIFREIEGIDQESAVKALKSFLSQ